MEAQQTGHERRATSPCERSVNGSCVSALSQDGASILVGRGHAATVGEGEPDLNRPDFVIFGWTRRDGPRLLTGVMEEDSGQNDGDQLASGAKALHRSAMESEYFQPPSEGEDGFVYHRQLSQGGGDALWKMSGGAFKDGDEGSGDRETRRSRRKEKKEKRREGKKSKSESKKHPNHDKDKDGCLGGSSGKHSKSKHSKSRHSKSKSEHTPDKKMMQGTVTSCKQFPIAEITFESPKCGVYDHPSVATTAETSGVGSALSGVTINHIHRLRQELLEAQESEGSVLQLELRIHSDVERLAEKHSRRQLELAMAHENLRAATDEREQLKFELDNVTKDNACLRRSLADVEDDLSDRRMDELLDSMSKNMILMKINRQKRKQLGRKISSPK